ncbi:MAG: cupredoxin domain-containing protein [Parcubacteria group bacterium]
MSNKRIFIIGGIVIFAFLVVVGILYYFGNNSRGKLGGESTGDAFLEELENIPVPEMGETPSNESVAVPVSVREAVEGASEQIRSFLVSVEKEKFTPSIVSVNKNDTVHINFTAVDDDYDVVVPDYGLSQRMRRGETKTIEFRAETEGTHVYYCESCGGLDSQAKGYIVVKSSTPN